ncbi:MAG TPA: hypothetical protein VE397_02015 [Stellaceae bacterium]|jgi:hypothetical protein|nr:hypothetical protein [Stellaceae bacterium]
MGERAVVWRRRAAELRDIAATERDATVRHLLLALAEEYEDLGALAAGDEERGSRGK